MAMTIEEEAAPQEMEMVIEEEEDTLKKSFDNVEEIESENSPDAVTKYKEILNDPRTDEIATKIKEQCIYKYVIYYEMINYLIIYFVLAD